MSALITLGLGNLEVDWSKHWRWNDHGALFQPQDLGEIDHHHFSDDEEIAVERKEGFSRKLGDMVDRLELLGVTVESARTAYEDVSRQSGGREGDAALPFDILLDALKTVDANEAVTSEYGDGHDFGEFFRREMAPRMGLTSRVERKDMWDVSHALENYDAIYLLRLLALNPANLDIPVAWRFADGIEQGLARREDIVAGCPEAQRLLLVTEGSSDAKVLAKALQLLRPNIADFFRFVDMEEGYPFTGTGNLFRFCQGLVKIGFRSDALIIYDNDAEGVSKFDATRALALPDSMRVLNLPDLDALRSISAIGPQGAYRDDINGRAAAIECYLDLQWKANGEPTIRWTSFNPQSSRYQGELIGKEAYTKRFLDLRRKEPGYNFHGILTVLSAIETEAIAMRSAG